MDRSFAELLSEEQMKLAVPHGAGSDYASQGAKLYFKYGSPKAKLKAQDKALVEALHQCAQPSDISIPGKEKELDGR